MRLPFLEISAESDESGQSFDDNDDFDSNAYDNTGIRSDSSYLARFIFTFPGRDVGLLLAILVYAVGATSWASLALATARKLKVLTASKSEIELEWFPIAARSLLMTPLFVRELEVKLADSWT